MCDRTPLAKALFLCFMLILISLVNLSYRQPASGEQKRFNDWLDSLPDHDVDGEHFSDIGISVEAIAADGLVLWELAAQPDQLPPARLLRLLNLIREAKLFSVSAGQRYDNKQMRVKVGVTSSSERFEVVLSQEDLAGNIQATTMLTLLREFTRPV